MPIETLTFDHERERLHEACSLTEEEFQEVFSFLGRGVFPDEWFDALPSKRALRKLSLWLFLLLKSALEAEKRIALPLFRLMMLILMPPEERNSHSVEKIEKTIINILKFTEDLENSREALKNFIFAVASELFGIIELSRAVSRNAEGPSQENRLEKPKLH